MAMAMREEAGKLIAVWRRHGCELGFGAGIAQGYATLGQIGFSDRSGYTAIAENRRLCATEGILPLIRERGEPHGSGLGTVRCVVEHANAWLLANKRLDRRNDKLALIIDGLLTTACIFMIANRITNY